MLPTSASFLVTENCNLACKYCFEKHNKKIMSVNVAKKALEFLSDNALKNKNNTFHAMLFGGEPLLNIDLIDEIFHMGEDIANQKHLKFTTSLITNATIMNDTIYEVLKYHKDSSELSIQLSVDGPEHIQNMYRVTKDGTGSFKLVEKNIERFKSLYKDCLSRLCIHGCINKNSVSELYNNYRFFKDVWGLNNIWFLPVAEEKWDSNDVSIYREQNELIYNDIRDELYKSKNIQTVRYYAPMDRCLLPNGRPNKPCGAGDSFVTINADGEIYPCHQIYFNDSQKETLIGNVFTGIDEDARRLYVEYDETYLNCPKDCDNNHCYRCLAANYVHNGSIFSQIKGTYCDMMSVDKEFQNKLQKDIKELMLIDKNDQNEIINCLCNSREGQTCNGCDIVHRQENCESGNNPLNPDCLCDIRGVNDFNTVYQYENTNKSIIYNQQPQIEIDEEFKDVVATALQLILEKIEAIEKKLEQKE